MSSTTATAEIARLRAHMERIQGRRMDAPVFPVPSALAALLPGGGLRAGAAYSVPSSMSLLSALLSGPSQAGSWCGVLGVPEFGAEAAEQMGVDLERLVLIPDPGPRWLAVTATVAEVLPMVVARPLGRVSDGQAARLAARLRESGGVMVVAGRWPQSEAVLTVEDEEWTGTGWGHGHLRRRELTVCSSSRRWSRPRRARLVLPDEGGGVRPGIGAADETATGSSIASADIGIGAGERAMRAVG